MNYFQLHIGDYEKATAHLTASEDGIYSRLLRRYYDTEQPIPSDIKAVQRLVRARSKDERDAVETVLNEFFSITPDGWRHGRCDEEIEAYRSKKDKARASANARWSEAWRNANASGESMLTHSERNANASETHSERNANASETHSERNANASETHNERNANQEPITNKSKSIKSTIVDLSTKPEKLALLDEAEISSLQNHEKPKPCPQQAIIAAYHETLPQLRQVREWTETRSKLLNRRWRESPERQSLGWWRDFFAYVGGSDFLMGRVIGASGRPFDCDLEWLIRPTNFSKVIEGRYENHRGAA